MVCRANGIDVSRFVPAADALLSRSGVHAHLLRADDLGALHIVDVRAEQRPGNSHQQWLVEIGAELEVGERGLIPIEIQRYLGETIRADERTIFVSVGTRVPHVLLDVDEQVAESTTSRFDIDSRAFRSAMNGAIVLVHVLSPPTTRDRAIETVLEWYDFDRDAFADGQTIDELASHSMHDSLWGWWWD